MTVDHLQNFLLQTLATGHEKKDDDVYVEGRVFLGGGVPPNLALNFLFGFLNAETGVY